MKYSACCRIHALVREAEHLQKEAGFWDGVGSFARGATNAVSGFGRGLWNAATAAPQALASGFKGFLTGGANNGGVVGGWNDAMHKTRQGFSQGFQGIGQMARPVNDMNQSIGQGVAAAGQAVGQGLNATGQAIGGAVDSAAQAVGDTASAAGHAVQQAGTGVWNDIMKGWNSGGAPAPTTNTAPAAAASPTGGTQPATGPAIPSPGQAPAGMSQPTPRDQMAGTGVSTIPAARPVAPWEDPTYWNAFR